MYKSVFINDIHNQLMTSVNPKISCIRMGSGPALFGLARFYCITNFLYSAYYIYTCFFIDMSSWAILLKQGILQLIIVLLTSCSQSNVSCQLSK